MEIERGDKEQETVRKTMQDNSKIHGYLDKRSSISTCLRSHISTKELWVQIPVSQLIGSMNLVKYLSPLFIFNLE